MSKAYSNKALPPGTVLREWRLEEVLGVGGFGIVYKARGIYFNELVAIKEYFPSSISERDEEATVVPIDSDAEEVHALGLKKFVEEAKLLWNLSTPSRHPNIVSVRSLFEIHGTAYMVMDFEDGTSLSRLLKNGGRFNERSLWDIIAPISEGLDRAHRVGVLHRDIKPPNILITPEGRSVLIDFGSARFDTAEATSTQVTFHTPPYAARRSRHRGREGRGSCRSRGRCGEGQGRAAGEGCRTAPQAGCHAGEDACRSRRQEGVDDRGRGRRSCRRGRSRLGLDVEG